LHSFPWFYPTQSHKQYHSLNSIGETRHYRKGLVSESS
jgi:hypothetical protein